MKKILLGCVAVSVLLAGIAVIGLNQKNTPQTTNVTAHQPALINVQTQPTQSVELTENIKTYSISEEQILEAAENFLYYQNLNDILHPDVRSDGDDFIITFDNPHDPDMPKYELKMERIADFKDKKQYKVTSESWIKWAEMIRANFDMPQVSADDYIETISWVPDLALTTNISVKASDIIISDKDMKIMADSVFADSMAGLQDDKLDIASAAGIENFTLKTSLFELSAPKIIFNSQINGAELSGDKAVQILTSKNATESLTLPNMQIHSVLLGQHPVTATMTTSWTFDKNPELNFDLSDIATQNDIPNLPQNVRIKVSASNITRAELFKLAELKQMYMQEENPQSDSAIKTDHEMTKFFNQIINPIDVKEITLTFANGTIHFVGTVHPMQSDMDMQGVITVTNFDILSPKPQPANKEACKEALKNISPTATQLPPECAVKQTGMLDYLRPFIDETKRTTNDKGQHIDTFNINYRTGHLSINGQEIMTQTEEFQPTEQ